MNLRKEIHQAYDHIHVPEEVSEKLKQELYQKDFREEELGEFQEEIFSGKRSGKYLSFVAASIILGVTVSVTMWGMLDHRSEDVLKPAATVPVEYTSETETPTETEFSEAEAAAEEAEMFVFEEDE